MRSRSAEELVFSLCHEVGNLLAAARLHAHLLDGQAERAKNAPEQIAGAAARAGSLLAQIRPLLSPPKAGALRVAPRDVLEAVSRTLEGGDALRVQIEPRSASGLPDAAIDPELLHHLLLTAVFGAVDAVDSGRRVRVRAEDAATGVIFVVEDDGEIGEETQGGGLRGRALARAVADAILRAAGGELEVSRSDAGTRLAFLAPVEGR